MPRTGKTASGKGITFKTQGDRYGHKKTTDGKIIYYMVSSGAETKVAKKDVPKEFWVSSEKQTTKTTKRKRDSSTTKKPVTKSPKKPAPKKPTSPKKAKTRKLSDDPRFSLAYHFDAERDTSYPDWKSFTENHSDDDVIISLVHYVKGSKNWDVYSGDEFEEDEDFQNNSIIFATYDPSYNRFSLIRVYKVDASMNDKIITFVKKHPNSVF